VDLLTGCAGRAATSSRWTAVEPTAVVEVAADSAFDYSRWRHTVRLHRLRPDLEWSMVGPISQLEH
jgi:hypothetical protein